MACTNCSPCNVSQIDYTSTCPGGCIRTTTSGVICSTNCSGSCSCSNSSCCGNTSSCTGCSRCNRCGCSG